MENKMDEDLEVEIVQQQHDEENQHNPAQPEAKEHQTRSPVKQEEFRLKVEEEVLVQKSLQSGQLVQAGEE